MTNTGRKSDWFLAFCATVYAPSCPSFRRTRRVSSANTRRAHLSGQTRPPGDRSVRTARLRRSGGHTGDTCPTSPSGRAREASAEVSARASKRREYQADADEKQTPDGLTSNRNVSRLTKLLCGAFVREFLDKYRQKS